MEQAEFSIISLKYPNEFQVTDHTVSKELFTLRFNKEFEMYETIPQPSKEDLPKYYESDDYISHTGSKRNLFERLYHLVRSYMLRSKLSLVNKHAAAKGRLLDVGCGTGDFLLTAKNDGWKVLGIEPNELARETAQRKELEVFYADQLAKLKVGSFDVITLWHVLEHLPKLEDHIKLFKKLLKPDGLLVIAVPNFKSYDAHYYKSYWAAYDVPRHLWHFSRGSIDKMFAKIGLHLFKTKPMWFDSFYVSILSEDQKGSKFGFIKGVIIGLFSNLKGLTSREYSSQIYLLRPKTSNKTI